MSAWTVTMSYRSGMRRASLLVTLLVAVLGCAAPAGAQRSNAPPGNSGVDEYLETVPEAGGHQPTRRDPSNSPLSAATRERLERAGADGQAAADLAERSSPKPDENDTPAVASPRGDPGVVRPLVRAAGGSGDGMGLWLPILLAVVAAGALTFGILKWRRSVRE